MQNRTPVAKEARPPLPDFTPVPRKVRHEGRTRAAKRVYRGAASPTPCFRRRWGDKFDKFRARTGADARERAARRAAAGAESAGGGGGAATSR